MIPLATRPLRFLATIAAACMLSAGPGYGQMQSVDPDSAIDGDLDGVPATSEPWIAADPVIDAPEDQGSPSAPAPSTRYDTAPAAEGAQPEAPAAAQSETTYAEDDLIGAAEGLFGQGAEGLARLIEDILAKQGEPNGYIVGREAGGAFVFGVRYGSGTLYHKIEGNMPVYWTGPSIGFDAGANAGNTFVLVYNLNDTEQLYERYPAGEGTAYLVGGFNAGYLRKDNVVLIPIRVGAGLRLGVNAGYMRFSRKQRWLPF